MSEFLVAEGPFRNFNLSPCFAFSDICVKMSSQPQAVATGSDGYTIVACLKEVLVLQNGHLLTSCPIKFEPSSVTIHPSQSEVAVGGKVGVLYIASGESGSPVSQNSCSKN